LEVQEKRVMPEKKKIRANTKETRNWEIKKEPN